MNPLYQQMKSQPNQMSGFMSQFDAFKKTFHGDPQQMVQQMLNSGRISQEQYNNAVQLANKLSGRT